MSSRHIITNITFAFTFKRKQFLQKAGVKEVTKMKNICFDNVWSQNQKQTTTGHTMYIPLVKK